MSSSINEGIQSVMIRHGEKMDEKLTTIADSINEGNYDNLQQLLNTVCSDDEYSYYLFQENSLEAWNNALLPISELKPRMLGRPVIETHNGWYYIRSIKIGQMSVYALMLIKSHYSVNNDYLYDAFNESLGIANNCHILLSTDNDGRAIYDKNGKFIFSIVANGNRQMTDWMMAADMIALTMWLVFMLWMLNVIMLLITKHGYNNRALIISAGVLVLIYVWALNLSVGDQMARWFLFSPQVFAYDWWAPSLVFLLLFATFSFVWCYYTFRWFDFRKVDKWQLVERRPCLVFFGLLMLIYGVYTSFNATLNVMVDNSTDLAIFVDGLDASGATIVKIIALTLMAISFMVVTERAYAEIIRNLSWVDFVKTFAIFCLLILIPSAFIMDWFEWTFFIGFVIINVLYYLIKRRFVAARGDNGEGAAIGMTYSSYVWIMFIIALFITQRLTSLNIEKEIQNRDILCNNLAFNLVREDDPVAETMLAAMEHNLSVDTVLQKFFSSEVTNADEEVNLYTYMRGRYFDGYFTRYDIQIIPCRGPESQLVINSTDEEYNCYEYFQNMVNTYGQRISPNSNFFGLNDNDGKASYFGQFRFYNKHTSTWERLFIEINQKTQMVEAGYPELLTNSRDRIDTRQLKGYSYAKYFEKRLQSTYGKCSYARRQDWTGDIATGQKKYINDSKYSHLVYSLSNAHTVVLSYPVMTIGQYIADYSYLFLGMFIISSVLLFLVGRRYLLYYNMSIHERIQSVFIIFVIVLLLFICVLSAWESMRSFESQSRDRLQQTLTTIKNSVSQELEETEFLDQVMADNILQRATASTSAEAHLYSPNGMLIGTSKRELFDNGIASPLINSVALQRLRGDIVNDESETNVSLSSEIFMHEKLGGMEYYAIYSDVTDIDDNVIGYLEVPHFNDVNAMRLQLMSTIMPITNAYMVVMLLAVLFSYFLARGITKPLLTISNSIREVRLQKKNKKIAYRGTDEIAVVINEYNRMIDELEHSAEQLALTEREMTWREMARQIAHEIKNPLTPMKLSVQYMIKAWEKASTSDDEESQQRFDTFIKKTANTLVEQIDQMAFIASEFSNVAKMKQGEITRVDIAEKLSGTALLYSKSENATVTYTSYTDHAFAMVNADQILSVFNNLIKNALQSVSQSQHVDINVSLEHNGQHVIIKVSDNGNGIAPEVQEKIFKPNFTTKSTGMGLGLAIVKTIVTNAKGDIWFDTEVGKGTTFYVKLPEA